PAKKTYPLCVLAEFDKTSALAGARCMVLRYGRHRPDPLSVQIVLPATPAPVPDQPPPASAPTPAAFPPSSAAEYEPAPAAPDHRDCRCGSSGSLSMAIP